MEGFDEVNDPRIAHTVHQGGYADVLLRPTMVGILRCGKMLPPQLNLVIEIEFADATTALWSENAGAHPVGATLSTDFEIPSSGRPGVLQPRAPLRKVPGVQLPHSAHAAVQRPERRGGAHNPMKGPLPLRPCGYLRRHGAQHRHRPHGLPAPQLHCRLSHRARAQDAASGVSTRSGDLARLTFKGLDGTMTDLFIHLVAYQLATLSGTGVSVLD